MTTNQAVATFGAGCFWGVEDMFRSMRGVIDTAVGFMGGAAPNPSYEHVCAGDTGYVEVCQITYDSTTISYAQLLDAFWGMHDPTQGNQQGPDYGSQYRSVIFTHTPEQVVRAQKSKMVLERAQRYDRPITTTIEPAQTFYRAEEYHQRYFEKHGGGVCHV